MDRDDAWSLYAERLTGLLGADRGNATLQQLLVAAAGVAGAAFSVGAEAVSRRRALLDRLMRSESLTPETLEALASDRDVWVRARVWEMSAWSAEQVLSMLETEPELSVRLSVLTRPGLPDLVYYRAAGMAADAADAPVPPDEEAGEVVVDHAAGGYLPQGLVGAAVVSFAARHPRIVDVSPSDAASIVAAVSVYPELMESLVNGDHAPWLRLLAARQPAVSVQAVARMLTSVAAGEPVDTASSSPVRLSKLAVGLLSRGDLSVASLDEVAAILDRARGGDSGMSQVRERLDAARRLAALGHEERLVALAGRCKDPGALKRFWEGLSAEGRVPVVARAVCESVQCTRDLFLCAAPVACADLEVDEDGYARGLGQTLVKAPLWMAYELAAAVEVLRCSAFGAWDAVGSPASPSAWFGSGFIRQVEYLAKANPGFGPRLVRDVLAHPQEWPEGTLVVFSDLCVDESDLVAHACASEVVAAAAAPAAGVHVLEQVSRLAVADAGMRETLTVALLEMLVGSTQPLSVLVDAALSAVDPQAGTQAGAGVA